MNKEAVLEGLLFVVGDEGLSIDQIMAILELTSDEVNSLVTTLKDGYQANNRGINLEVLGNTLKLVTKSEHKEYYQRLMEQNDSRLSDAALETLAIIAYNEPITRVKVDEIRGVASSHIVSRLVAKELISNLGRSDLPGRPMLYGVTPRFLDYFGLSDKDQLPKLEAIKEEYPDEVELFKSNYKES